MPAKKTTKKETPIKIKKAIIPKYEKPGRPAGSTSKRSEALTKKNKKLMIASLQKNLGILAPALKEVSVSRSLFNKWYYSDLEFRELVDDIREEAIDFVEAQLFKQIKDGGAAPTIFYLKTKGKHRGYVEQTDTNMTIDAVRIKYIVPSDQDKIIEGENIPLPLDNQVIKLNLPEN
jgi:hypothetical protein